MKKILSILTVITVTIALTSCDDKQISYERLPNDAQIFIETHFSGVGVIRVESDFDSYDVLLQNGYEIDFYKSGEWKSIDGNFQILPASFLNTQPFDIISVYVDEQYTGSFITEVEKDKQKNGYEVTLNNGLELIFEWDGAFRNIDR